MTLAEFLLARIAEDEAVAKAAAKGPWLPELVTHIDHDKNPSEWETWWVGRGITAADHSDDDYAVVSYGTRVEEGGHSRQNADHIARHDPARVLAECDAKRRIVERCRQAHVDQGIFGEDGQEPLADDILRLLALPYSDHPDFKPEWRALERYVRRHEKDGP